MWVLKRRGPSFTAAIIPNKRSWTVWQCLADRNSLEAIHRIKGVKEERVSEWLQRAAGHIEEIEALLLANYPVGRVQLDALWTYVGHKCEKGGEALKRPEAGSLGVRPLR